MKTIEAQEQEIINKAEEIEIQMTDLMMNVINIVNDIYEEYDEKL